MGERDQIIDATVARSIQADAERKHLWLAWVVTQDQDGYDGQFAARLMTTDAPTPYVLLADTLAGLHAQLPPHLERTTGHHLVDPPAVVEVWFVSPGSRHLH
jgi:hypothetical protein